MQERKLATSGKAEGQTSNSLAAEFEIAQSTFDRATKRDGTSKRWVALNRRLRLYSRPADDD